MCATGYGIRRSKDLRAEIGKFPNSTNERKNMSTKTNFKRVALVAVTALGLGVLTSVAPANATAGFTVTANGGDTASSRGIVSGTTGSALTGTTNTMSIVTGGRLWISAGSNTTTGIAVSGATITSCFRADGSTSATLNSTSTTCTNSNDEATLVGVSPNAGVTTFTVSQFTNSYVTEQVRLTVSVVAATTVGAFSPVYSNIKVQHAEDNTTTLTGTANADDKYTNADQDGFYDATYGAVSTTTRINGVKGYLNFQLKDINDTILPTTTVISVTATGGCLVAFNSGTALGSSASTTLSADGTDSVAVSQAVANTPYKCVVTLAANGATIATRTFTLQGQVTKLVVSDQVIAKSATTTSAALYVDAQDAAGNSVPDVTVTPVSSTYNASVTSLSVSEATEVTAGTPVSATCDAKGTNAGLKFYAQNASAALIYSDAFSLSCAGSPVNYSASLDKASYAIGEVATLTITAKDSAGNLTWDGAELGNSTTAAKASANAVSIAGGPLTQVGSIVSTDSFTSGVKKYKFTVGGISGGSFQLAVDLPALNSTTYNQSAVTVAYKVTTDNGGVSNADVLKAIVSLIASINKQIAALQKALLKK